MEKLELYILKSIFENLPDTWNISDYVTIKYSNVMKSLYLEDFPNVWKNEQLRKRIGTIGANDYFNKWTGSEFMVLEDTPLNSLFGLVKKDLADGSMINGKRTGIPLSGGNHQILFYNKKYTNTVPDNFDELIETAEQVKKDSNLEYGVALPSGATYFVLPMLYGFGADLWATPGAEPIPEKPLFKFISWFGDLIYNKKVLPVKWEQAESMDCFMNGRSAYCIGGDWNINEFDNALNHNLGISMIPKLDRECRSTCNANYLYVSKELRNELNINVEKFCKKALSQEIQTQLMQKLYRMPASNNYKVDENKMDGLLLDSYKIYNKSYILPALTEVSNMYHVLADLLEPDILVSDTPENLTKNILKNLKNINSYKTVEMD